MADTTDYERTDRPVTAQPPPVDNGGELVHAFGARRLDEAGLVELANLLVDRGAFGVRKHGQPLRAGNGRTGAADALEEVLDALAYVTQEAIERFDVEAAETEMWRDMFWRLARIGEDLRLIWEGRKGE